MKINNKHVLRGIPALGIATVLALVAWAGNPQRHVAGNQVSQDTVPAKNNKATRQTNERDLDKEIRQFEEAKEKLKEVDWDKIQQSVDAAYKKIDFEQIQEQIDKAMKQINLEEINRQVEASLKSIDLEKMQQAVDESLKNATAVHLDKEVIKKELEAARLEVEKELKNGEERKKEMERHQKLNKETIQKEMEHARKEMVKAMENIHHERLGWKEKLSKAHEEIDKAKEEFKGYQDMIYSLEKEGLLSTKDDYTIQYKDGELHINGKQQPAEVLNRYKKYFKKHDKVTIRKKSGDMDIDTDSDDKKFD